MHSPPRATRLVALLFLIPLLLGAPPSGAESGPVGFDGRVVVAPVNLAVDPGAELQPGVHRVWHELLEHFVEEGHLVAALEEDSARALWALAVADVRGADPQAGIHAVYARFARAVAEEAEFSSMIFPALVTRAAEIRGEHAAWDGVRHWLAVPRLDDAIDTLPSGGVKIFSQGGNGQLAAASLHVAVYGPDGALRYEGKGGLTLLQELVRGEPGSPRSLVARLRSEPFADEGQLRQGIEAAFRQPNPLPAALAPGE